MSPVSAAARRLALEGAIIFLIVTAADVAHFVAMAHVKRYFRGDFGLVIFWTLPFVIPLFLIVRTSLLLRRPAAMLMAILFGLLLSIVSSYIAYVVGYLLIATTVKYSSTAVLSPGRKAGDVPVAQSVRSVVTIGPVLATEQ